MVRISEAIKDDHRRLESYYNIILNSEDKDELTQFQNQFVWELARHAVAEELVVFPALEKVRSDGKEKIDDDRREHSALKEMLYVFQDLNSTDPRFFPTITMLMEGLARHMQDEEANDLVILEETLTSDQSEALGESLSRTKMFVPSRAHPYNLDNPRFETAADLITAPLDRLQDLFRQWPEEESMLAAPLE
ncbi:hypothetical protein PENPOL_c001G08751 [Penicillium polonicum]|uniref:Hemerythrin-like domain-containing protein n=1 Tax=Penicillium polonicum TaxID=60169 RepID=A0A1V6P5H2_PENPO|nr:hypothetical protein PENPOL_c001G08751 [Penicillium polonicum]